MAEQLVLYSVENGVAVVELNRPDRGNALDFAMVSELKAILEQADEDKSVRVIVLTGAGKSFCVGVDAQKIAASDNTDVKQVSKGAWPLWPLDPAKRYDYQSTHNFLPAISKPIIAMLNGSAAGIGLVYALFCDLRFASQDARFSTAFVRRGVPAEHGLAWLLPRIVGQARAADLLLSGRKFDAAEAEQLGLVNRTVPSDELRQVTLEYASEMATWCTPGALRAIKRQMWEAPFQTLAESTMMFKELLPECMGTKDFREASISFVERRKPVFKDE